MELSTELALIVYRTIEMTLLLIPLTTFLFLTDASSATLAATPEATTSTPTQGFILYLLLSICNWFLQIISETKLVHCIYFHPDPSPTPPAVTPGQNKGLCPAIKLNACNCTYSSCSQVYVTWIAIETQTFTLIYSAGAGAGAVAGALLDVIVVVACAGIILNMNE